MNACATLVLSGLLTLPLAAQSASSGAAAIQRTGSVSLMPAPWAPGASQPVQLDPNDADFWSSVASMSSGRRHLVAVVVNGKIYAIGGETNSVGTSKINEAFDPALNTWTLKAPMSVNRSYPSAETANGKVYVFGGINLNTGAGLSSVEEYTPATDTWANKASMSVPRYSTAAATVNGNIYVIGGGSQSWNKVEVYSPVTNSWTVKASMPTGRQNLVAAAVNGKIYAIGGQLISGAASSAVEEYDPATNSWTARAPMPTGRYQSAAATLDGKIYVMGGRGASGDSLAFTDVYDPATNNWAPEASMSIDRASLAAAAVDGKIYAIGGSAVASAFLATVERLHVGLQILWDQTDSPADWGWVDQVFTDLPSKDTYQVSDFSTNGEIWRVNQVKTYYSMGWGLGSWHLGGITQAKLQVYPKTGSLPLNGSDTVPEYTVAATLNFDEPVPGGFVWELSADTSGIAELQNINGDFWIGLTPMTSNATDGFEYHLVTTASVGTQNAARNPGNGWGLGTSWFPLSAFGSATTIGSPYELTIRLVGSVPEGTWTDLGSGLAGISGIPHLAGTGMLTAGSPGNLFLTAARPSSPALLFVSLASTPVPFKGGVLLTFPFLLSVPLATDSGGALMLPFLWPAGVPSATSLYFQYAVQDVAALHGAALSNALKAITP